ncbi:MAG TPA: dihydrolipoyl dehydrogenase [Candidatus Limiplasma stercoravium]|nr:dihydrolipoyl dehydrogenase [Candidatus Limiplasma stercoravium]
MEYAYDVAVLGGGPGGYEAAIRCAQYGLKTALVEARELGGTCLNRGCIPTKALLHGAEVWETVGDARALGIRTEGRALDYAALAAFKERQVSLLRRGVESLEKAHGVEVVAGFGRLENANTLEVEGRRLTARRVILATGSQPALPPIPGAQDALTSDGVLSLTALPASLVIVGGGVIGMEFATLFSSLGVKVTVLEMLPDILPGVDARLSALLRRSLKRRRVDIINNARVTEIGSTVRYEVDGEPRTVQAERCAVCTGRRPQTQGIGLEAVGVRTQRGYVCVNDRMETSVPGIYAVGDITGGPQLAHAASAQGLVAAANCAGLERSMQGRAVPACVYTRPEIACVGLDEQTARAQGRQVRTGVFDVAGNGRCAVMNERLGLCVVVADAQSDELLGAQIMAPRATDLIAEVAAVMRLHGTAEDLANTIHPHPTVSEIVMEAAHDVSGLCCHALPRKQSPTD